MKKIILFLLLSCLYSSVFPAKNDGKNTEESHPDITQKKYVGIRYFNQIFGQVHLTTDRYSRGLTTVACGHPIKIYSNKDVEYEDWSIVKVGSYEGYILKKYLSESKETCFQEIYPKFFNSIELSVTDLYFWGRLYDHYFTSSTRPQ